MILVAALIAQHDKRPILLRDQQIGSAISVEVRSDQSARLVKFYGVEADFIRDVLEAIRTEVSKESNLAAIRRFPNDCEIDPTIIVKVDGCDSPALLPPHLRQRNLLEVVSIYVSPQSHSGSIGVGESKIHPAVLVEIQSSHSSSFGGDFLRPRTLGFKCTFSLIDVNAGCRISRSEHQIDRTVVIHVTGQHHAGSTALDGGLLRHVSKRVISVVPE